MDDPVKLLDSVINYLKNQKEIFGDFEVPSSSSDSKVKTVNDQEMSTTQSVEPATEPVPNNKKSNTNDVKAEQPTPIDNDSQKFDSDQVNTATFEDDTGDASFNSPDLEQQNGLFETSDDESEKSIYDEVAACQSLDELREISEHTDILKTDLPNTNLVFGVGNPHADLMLIGEAPGFQEDKQGEPFVGKAGQLLNKILKAIKLNREDVYIANILKHRPPNNRDPKPEERKRSLPFLLKQIEIIDPKIILCLGKVSATTMLDRHVSLKKLRGQFHKFRGKYDLMVTYHPAALLRNQKWKRPTWEDMKLLRKHYDELGCKP